MLRNTLGKTWLPEAQTCQNCRVVLNAFRENGIDGRWRGRNLRGETVRFFAHSRRLRRSPGPICFRLLRQLSREPTRYQQRRFRPLVPPC